MKIINASSEHTTAIDNIARQYPSELAFVSKIRIQERIERGEAYVSINNDTVTGFILYHQRRDGWSTVYDLAVNSDYLRSGIGSALLNKMNRPTRLKCKVDNIRAMAFYHGMGFKVVQVESGLATLVKGVDLKIIYCRGNDRQAPQLAQHAGMLYGVRYDCTAYSKNVYMVDGGLNPRWSTYMRKLRKYNPFFALSPDYMKPDAVELELRIRDIKDNGITRVGICPKFDYAVNDIPHDCIICESIPSEYAGWLIPDDQILPGRDYHLLGGDPVLQKSEIERITRLGGHVISVDGNKIALKAAHGQLFSTDGKWVVVEGWDTPDIAKQSAFNLVEYLMS